MKNYFKILGKTFILLAALLTVTACDTDDDINAIFREQTWFLTYVQDGNTQRTPEKNIYSIDFKNDNFTATMPNGATINGKWNANGDKSHSFTCRNITTTGTINGDIIAEKILNILTNAKRYSGDTNWLQIIHDKSNYMQLYN